MISTNLIPKSDPIKDCLKNIYSALGPIEQINGFHFLKMNVESPFLNSVVQAPSYGVNVADVKVLNQLLKTGASPFTWWVEDEQASPLVEILLKEGLTATERFSVLSYDLRKSVEISQENKLLLQQVSSLASLNSWCDLQARALNISSKDYDTFFLSHLELFIGKTHCHLIGTNEEEDVSIGSMLFKFDKTAYIYNIFTLPESRLQGFGTKITKNLIIKAITLGFEEILLLSPERHLDLFEKMGFEEKKIFTLFEKHF